MQIAQFTQTDSITYHLNWANVLAGLAEPQKVMDREAKLHTASAISWTEGPDCTARRLSGPRTLLRTIRLRRATKLLEALPDETPSQQLLVLPAAVPLDVPASAAANSSKPTPDQPLCSKKSHLNVPKNPSTRTLSRFLAFRDIDRVTCPASNASAQLSVM